MFLDISKLETQTAHIERVYAAGDIPFDYKDYILADNWTLTADVTKNTREEVSIKGLVAGRVHVFCDRCLEPFDVEIRQPFDMYLIPAAHVAAGREEEIKTEGLDENYYRDPRLSLVDIVNEQIILNLPVKILCQPDCQGLCPGCGGNLNRGDCHCQVKEGDPRWMLLREMQKRMKK
jgi:uncharacterized protein